jgi:pyruvate dehydrogenase E2 component (dihydrolipoamide acetyltransferase)
MADITMPKLSDTMTEGVLVQWKKKQGETVTMGEVIAEVETDKATMEMEAFEDGVLTELYVKEGTKVTVGTKIARIGEDATPGAGLPLAGTATQDTAGKTIAAPFEKTAKTPAASAPVSASGRVKASPLARKVATSLGVDLTAITGSGPGGRIIRQDVTAASGNGKQSAPPAAAPVEPVESAGPAKAASKSQPKLEPNTEQRLPLSSMRKIIAERLLASKTQIPHFYLHIEVDAAPLMKLRSEVNAVGEQGGNKLSVNDFILKAVAVAVGEVPKVNASFAGDAIVEFGSLHLAVAVAIDDGLVTPVIRDATSKSLREISLQVKDFAARARSRKLKPEEFQGGTFTVSNLGSYGIDRFDAIINPPQAAILSVGAVVKKPVVNPAGEVVAGQRIDLGLSCDHRVVDGALGAQFLAALRRLLEQPLLLLLS